LPVIGGLQSATFEIGKYLSENNWNVSVITNRYPRALKSCETISGIKVNRYTFLANPFHYLRSGRIDLFFAWLFYKPMTLIRLIIHFNRIKPTIVNLHFPDHQIIECYLLLLIFRFKLIISLHGNEVERMSSLSKRSIRYYIYNKLFTSAINITGCSKFLVNELQRNFKVRYNNKSFSMYNGVSELFLTQKINIQKREYIFCAARFVPKKGLDLIYETFRQITDTQLFIAGGCEKEFIELGLKEIKGIDLLGSLSHDELAMYLADAKLTVIPSKEEPYGIIVAEALCCGSPVVATNVGGIPEVIAIATEKLNEQEKHIFNSWVKLVNPLTESIIEGIEAITNNNSNIEDFINIIPKIRDQFRWGIRADDYLIKVNLL
jgi:glycosyltransferase involved in cell wall biosynthesis